MPEHAGDKPNSDYEILLERYRKARESAILLQKRIASLEGTKPMRAVRKYCRCAVQAIRLRSCVRKSELPRRAFWQTLIRFPTVRAMS